MKYEQRVLICKSASPFFEWEASGEKPNTVRAVPDSEILALARCQTVRVCHTGSDAEFEREITGIFDVTEGMAASGVRRKYNTRYVVICWEHPEGAR